MIELRHIQKVFHTPKGDIHACQDVNLTIQTGEIFGVIGYSGAGKSTLVRIINQLEKQTSGEVMIDGEDISLLNPKDLRKKRTKMGMIFQHFNLLWSRTVQKNIELPLEIAGVDKEIRKKKTRELIELVGLQGRENAYPSELSGGQKQRVGIARALANDPSILLCDEATSALDPDTTEQILDLLKDINRKLGITIVMITHQMEVVQKICHRVAVMSEGKVVEVGRVKDIFEHPQHTVTKRFVRDISSKIDDDKQNENLKKIYPNGILLRLTFDEDISRQPIVSRVMKETTLDISIVSGNLTNTIDSSFGVLIVNVLGGTKQDYENIIQKFQDYHVIVEVI
ncbi:ATP-binding cassette domain-containing protein [Clostridium sp. C1]|uniref:methionine ABC transporter ATP-binding protein n=1 Tax=Clostridium sp. C1 TaxID=1155388 RepID=UPI001BA8220B|nr:ATP-binding cassette domain-containing protein [Clostridium sp. C1]QUN12981.1 ATP-binding cassette domain-containing protein [Clostridium sp. C1]